jgi:formylmethanofuran dehydrogenase subunit E
MMPLANPSTGAAYNIQICGYSYGEYIDAVKRFHGYASPGVIIGGFMVDAAVRNLPEGILYDAICETRSCLPDAIQLLTPCTIGNGWLKVVNTGRFALTLYDKQNNEGVRVFIDAEKVEAWQEIKAWYFKLKSGKEQTREAITREIKEAGDSIFSVRRVKVQPQIAEKKHKRSITVCPECREAYPADDGEICLACQGNVLYV